ncbi:hypothetical protein ACJRO7_017020 [Eucalyptus globulus]|uniref:Uncharacterized protein n=1 Tax=Eucalyptus globulus TaxID=34317 RepID=A0ABD3KQT7_EUCGL
MANDMRYMNNWGEVAPTLLLSYRRSSSSPRLETILEEGSEEFRLVVNKRMLFILPVLFSLISYFLLYRNALLENHK